jgi:hypothetical protein
MVRTVYRISFALLLISAVTTTIRITIAGATGKLLSLDSGSSGYIDSRCEVQRISAKFSPTASQYDSNGVCNIFYVYYSGGEDRVDNIKWEAIGKHTPNLNESEESISLLRLVRPDQPNYFSVGKITAKMTCKQDPWLNPERFGCKDLFYGRSESLNKYDLTGLYAKDRNFPRTSLISGVQRAALNQQYQRYVAVRPQYKPGSGNLQMQNKAIQPKSQVGAATGSSQCNPGFEWRMAGPSDYVCVTPESRQRAQQENATATSRRNPKGGAYGPNTCLPGFVWRSAFAGDVVCVTPEVRRVVQQENELSSSRSTGPAQLMRR